MKAMKKIILLALTALMMVGCDEKSIQPKELILNTYIVDSCEYVGWEVGRSYGILAHKGNCQFCAKRRKQELELLVKHLKEK